MGFHTKELLNIAQTSSLPKSCKSVPIKYSKDDKELKTLTFRPKQN